MPSIRTENLEMAYQVTVLFTSALSPPFVNAGVRFLDGGHLMGVKIEIKVN